MIRISPTLPVFENPLNMRRTCHYPSENANTYTMFFFFLRVIGSNYEFLTLFQVQCIKYSFPVDLERCNNKIEKKKNHNYYWENQYATNDIRPIRRSQTIIANYCKYYMVWTSMYVNPMAPRSSNLLSEIFNTWRSCKNSWKHGTSTQSNWTLDIFRIIRFNKYVYSTITVYLIHMLKKHIYTAKDMFDFVRNWRRH